MHVVTKESDPAKLIPYLRNRSMNKLDQRRQIDLVARLNRLYAATRSAHEASIDSAIESMEVAYHMQSEALDVFDIRTESAATLDRYGDSDFGRGCLMARRLVERGVRVVQVYFGAQQPWDSHNDIESQRMLAAQADPAIASLLTDLKDRGLFDQTLVVCGSEFGRTPVLETSGLTSGRQNGRDHNPFGFSTVLAGGGVRGGTTYGSTDDFGFYATDKPVHMHDIHATILHLLGLDHTKLTYRFSGRDFRLTDVAGHVLHDVIASSKPVIGCWAKVGARRKF